MVLPGALWGSTAGRQSRLGPLGRPLCVVGRRRPFVCLRAKGLGVGRSGPTQRCLPHVPRLEQVELEVKDEAVIEHRRPAPLAPVLAVGCTAPHRIAPRHRRMDLPPVAPMWFATTRFAPRPALPCAASPPHHRPLWSQFGFAHTRAHIGRKPGVRQLNRPMVGMRVACRVYPPGHIWSKSVSGSSARTRNGRGTGGAPAQTAAQRIRRSAPTQFKRREKQTVPHARLRRRVSVARERCTRARALCVCCVCEHV